SSDLGSGLKRTDVPSFSTNNPTFNFIAFNMENRNGVLDGTFRGLTLYGLNNNFLGFFASGQFGFSNNVFNLAKCLGTRFLAQIISQLIFGLLGCKPCNRFQLRNLLIFP